MKDNLKRKRWVLSFEKPRTSPNTLEPSTTVLSPYLKFGCLSSRLLLSRLRSIYAEAGRHTKPPVSLEGQLFWREFYYYNSVTTPNYDKMVGNPICRQIPWRVTPSTSPRGPKGAPVPLCRRLHDAAAPTGLDPPPARHMVACFLTRGDLWISWEEGARVFDRLLVDADWALNNGNWMWLASCFFYQYFRVYSPVAFGRKTDKEGKYIRSGSRAAKVPQKYIYEPWKAPLAVQRRAGASSARTTPRLSWSTAKSRGKYGSHEGCLHRAPRRQIKGCEAARWRHKDNTAQKAGKRVKSAR